MLLPQSHANIGAKSKIFQLRILMYSGYISLGAYFKKPYEIATTSRLAVL